MINIPHHYDMLLKDTFKRLNKNQFTIGVFTLFIFQIPWSLILKFNLSLTVFSSCFFCVFYINSSCTKEKYPSLLTNKSNFPATLCWTKIVKYFWTNKTTIVPLNCYLKNKLGKFILSNSALVNNSHKLNSELFFAKMF